MECQSAIYSAHSSTSQGVTPSPVNGANTSRLVMGTRSEYVCETTSAEPATKRKKHYRDYVRDWRPGASLRTQEQPNLDTAKKRPQPRQGQRPCAPVLPGSRGKPPLFRGKAQQRLAPRPSSGVARAWGATAKQEGRKEDKKKGRGQKEVWKGYKKPRCGPEPPPLPVLNAVLGPAASGTREMTTSWFLRNVQEHVRRQLFGA